MSDKEKSKEASTLNHLGDLGNECSQWCVLANEWLSTEKIGLQRRKTSIRKFLIEYISKLNMPKDPEVFLGENFEAPSFFETIKVKSELRDANNDDVYDFLDWILVEKYSKRNDDGLYDLRSGLKNPFSRIKKKQYIRDDPYSFEYLLKIDKGFKDWQVLADIWIKSVSTSKTKSKMALKSFFVDYIAGLGIPKKPADLLSRNYSPPALTNVMVPTSEAAITKHDLICDFLDWILENDPIEFAPSRSSYKASFHNPFTRSRTQKSSRKIDKNFTHYLNLDPNLEHWCKLGSEWLGVQETAVQRKCAALKIFFWDYIHNLKINTKVFSFYRSDFICPELSSVLNFSAKTSISKNDDIYDFVDWVFVKYRAKIDVDDPNRSPDIICRNPFERIQNRADGRSYDLEFKYLLDYDLGFEEWRNYAKEWIASGANNVHKKVGLAWFFMSYIHGQQISKNPKLFFDAKYSLPEPSLSKQFSQEKYHVASDFLNWVLKNKFSTVDQNGYQKIPEGMRNPLPVTRRKVLGKSNDIEFKYLLEIDPSLEEWRVLAAKWIVEDLHGIEHKRHGIDKFLLHYIYEYDLERRPSLFLLRSCKKPISYANALMIRKNKARGFGDPDVIDPHEVRNNNIVHYFLKWVLLHLISVEDDADKLIIPYEFENPVPLLTSSGSSRSETIRSPLPYRYIRELRAMLAQGRNFKDWVWAQTCFDSERRLSSMNWFVVDKSVINEADPDCVWRKRAPRQIEKKINSDITEVYELWSPASAVSLYLKLELPLRTFQVRMLDSGEADTWRYESGKWAQNNGKLAPQNTKKIVNKGVFNRGSIDVEVGLYINTNKTADINKSDMQTGYVIPWTHEVALYWLEKLRNWQEKYNPLLSPTPWLDLKAKHFGSTPPHKKLLRDRGACCFLFRNAAGIGVEKGKPIGDPEHLWYQLLKALEDRCKLNGEESAEFVRPNPEGIVTYYPLHSLRVSLITAYALDGGVPFAVLSKLIAGHQRLIMTIYYIKMGRAYLTDVMNEAEKKLLETDVLSYKRFLLDKSHEEIEKRFAINGPDGINVVRQQKSTGSFLVDDKGICPAGGALCDIGGEVLSESTLGKKNSIFLPVAGYPVEKNCVRCRFFITGPAFISGLQAQANTISYKITECSNRFIPLQDEVQRLEKLKFQLEKNNEIFIHQQEYVRLNLRYEEEAEKANKLMMDLQSTVKLMDKCMKIAEETDENGVRLVSFGDISNIRYALTETTSELHQLEVICENSVIYPQVDAGKAVIRRGQILDSMLQLYGKSPIFFKLSQDQQLLIGNEVMKLIQARSGGLKEAVELAEGKRMMVENGLLDEVEYLISNKSDAIPMANLMREAVPKNIKLISPNNGELL